MFEHYKTLVAAFERFWQHSDVSIQRDEESQSEPALICALCLAGRRDQGVATPFIETEESKQTSAYQCQPYEKCVIVANTVYGYANACTVQEITCLLFPPTLREAFHHDAG